MEYMTVYFTEDFKTVSGYESDHPRYIGIKEAIFELVATDLYEEWEKQIIEHFDKVNEEEITRYLESFDDELLRSEERRVGKERGCRRALEEHRMKEHR